MFTTRSKHNIALTPEIVIKEIKTEDEDTDVSLMCAFPRVFIPVLLHTEECYVMARGFAIPLSEKRDALKAGFRLLRDHLWTEKGCKHSGWETALIDRIGDVCKNVDVPKTVSDPLVPIIKEIFRKTDESVCIHGDPTFENLVTDKNGVGALKWIDPIHRRYIPCHRAVDVGKAFQSCWAFEEVSQGVTNDPQFDRDLAKDICDIANVDFDLARAWCIVHIIRFLPYVDQRMRDIYIGVLAQYA